MAYICTIVLIRTYQLKNLSKNPLARTYQMISMNKLLSVKKVSRWLSGNETSIRSNSSPIIYREAVAELNDLMRVWCEKYPEHIKEVIEVKIVETKESEAVEIVKVAEEHKKDVFKQLNPSVACLTKNRHCYRVNKVIIGKGVFTEYFYDLDQAKEYLDNLI